jgi:hypothetical protein
MVFHRSLPKKATRNRATTTARQLGRAQRFGPEPADPPGFAVLAASAGFDGQTGSGRQYRGRESRTPRQREEIDAEDTLIAVGPCQQHDQW